MTSISLCTTVTRRPANVISEVCHSPDAIADKFSEDAVIVHPDIPDIVGKESIHNMINGTLPAIKLLNFDFKGKQFCVKDIPHSALCMWMKNTSMPRE